MCQGPMTDISHLKHCLQTLKTGVAVVDPDDWSIIFENAKFFQWFSPGDDLEPGHGCVPPTIKRFRLNISL